MEKRDIKNIFVLHSLNGDTLEIWGKQVNEVFSKKGITVIMPKFPIRAESSFEKFDSILQEYLEAGMLSKNSIVIAHSIGNPYFMRFCREHNYKPDTYIAVAPGGVYEYPITRTDYIVDVLKYAYVSNNVLDFIKNMSSKKYCLYSDEDDKNLEKFTRFINDTEAKGMYLEGYNHFDGYHKIFEVPELIKLIDEVLEGK